MFILFLLTMIAAGVIYLNLPKFGSLPKGEDLIRIQASLHYKNGRFQNINPTPQMSEDTTFLKVMTNYLFGSHPYTKPSKPVPAIKSTLKNLPQNENTLVWFGHSSYLIQSAGKTFLIDPVFSKTASPIPFNVVAFEGTDIYSSEDMPDIDYLIISHDHWDHLDYPTIKKLKPRIKKIICGLGVGAHFKRWGFDENTIVEMDWNTKESLDDATTVYAFPARHFSGRSIFPNKSLWMSFVVDVNKYKFYVGGDSGYDDHYQKIGAQFGSIDLAVLDAGQYDNSWKYIHENPDEVVQAALDLKAKFLLPVHHSKFTISNHPWNEPLKRLTQNAKDENFKLLTPKIGQSVNLDNLPTQFDEWWLFD